LILGRRNDSRRGPSTVSPPSLSQLTPLFLVSCGLLSGRPLPGHGLATAWPATGLIQILLSLLLARHSRVTLVSKRCWAVGPKTDPGFSGRARGSCFCQSASAGGGRSPGPNFGTCYCPAWRCGFRRFASLKNRAYPPQRFLRTSTRLPWLRSRRACNARRSASLAGGAIFIGLPGL